jgi:hypothetical protein
MRNQVTGNFLFQKSTINRNTYLDMLQLYAVPHTEKLQPHIILQRDCAPIRAYLDKKFPEDRLGEKAHSLGLLVPQT